MSNKMTTQKQLDQHANQDNSNNTDFSHNNKDYKDVQNNRSRQLNPKDPKFNGKKK